MSVCCDSRPQQKCTPPPVAQLSALPTLPRACARHTGSVMKTRSAHALPHVPVSSSAELFLLHSQLFSPSSLTPSPLSLSLFALASFSIHRSPPPPLSLGPGHMRKGRLGRCSSEKKEGKNALLLFLQAGPPL